jgi:hypothetical protein
MDYPMKCTGGGTPIETFYSAPAENGGAGHYCSRACVAEAVKKWTGFSCHVCWFKPESGSGDLHHFATVPELRRLLQPYKDQERLVICLDRDLGETGSVWVFATGDRAFVTHITLPGGVDSYCRSKENGPDATIGILLSNCQMDMIHWSWTVPRSDGISALEYFLEHGQRDPELCWVTDPSGPFDEPAVSEKEDIHPL